MYALSAKQHQDHHDFKPNCAFNAKFCLSTRRSIFPKTGYLMATGICSIKVSPPLISITCCTIRVGIFYVTSVCAHDSAILILGVELMGTCMTVIDLTANIIAIISLVMGCVILGLIIHMKKQMDPNSVSTERKKPPPYNARGRGPTNTKKGWA